MLGHNAQMQGAFYLAFPTLLATLTLTFGVLGPLRASPVLLPMAAALCTLIQLSRPSPCTQVLREIYQSITSQGE